MARSSAATTDDGLVLTNVSVINLTNVTQADDAITSVSTIAERLKLARGTRSQADVAAAAGVSAGTIGNIESGSRKVPRELFAIAAAVGVDPLWLQTGRGSMRPASRPATSMEAAEESAPAYAPLADPADVLAAMGTLLKTVSPNMRSAFADVLQGWAASGGAEDRREALLALLGPSGKRRQHRA